eukprot:TRINITY_DN58306_c0_g1_i1.p1 TRINITY_DN58306_c0_g1~~TRINITY_DN58306_c0_g1_i1.p1  ORF type:complete len:968 (+),score=-64.39 TRINITY_DN58306_c0_g1_i1:305-2905(+)
MKKLKKAFEFISLNDVCCYTPVWFGVVATLLLGFMTYVAASSSSTSVTSASACASQNSKWKNGVLNTRGFQWSEVFYSRVNQALCAAMCMAIIPAHIMRSVGGGYDNESVAITTMCLTFGMWMYSISVDIVDLPPATANNNKDKENTKDAEEPVANAKDPIFTYIFFGALSGLAYVCMVATWGGYIFVCNLIGLHAFLLVFPLGRFSKKLYWVYSTYYLVGTFGATCVPVVGLAPVKSLEQLAPFLVFLMYQGCYLCEFNLTFINLVLGIFGGKTNKNKESNNKKDKNNNSKEKENNVITLPLTMGQRITMYMVVGTVGVMILSMVVAVLWPTGYFGPLSSRVRGLFVTHTRTGNPLVDSVAEHQPASAQAFFQFLHYTCTTAPIGFLFSVYYGIIRPWLYPPQVTLAHLNKSTTEKLSISVMSTDPMVFVAVYAVVTYQFATKMNRLMLLMGPISSVLTGICFGCFFDFVTYEVLEMLLVIEDNSPSDKSNENGTKSPKKGNKSNENINKPRKDIGFVAQIGAYLMTVYHNFCKYGVVKIARKVIAVAGIYYAYKNVPEFYRYSQEMGQNMSNPSIMFQARLHDGSVIMVDDYREAYWWLRDNTPYDARVMAWWDYGYQITGIGNRTTIADGNTWNHEHIALLGKCLTSPEKRAHSLIKHLADYVLLWTGGGGDDLAKSPHMARIANSVFNDVCPGDPTCSHFGFYNRQLDPTPSMAESLLYKLSVFHQRPGVQVDEKLFSLVYQSKYGKVRIYKVHNVHKGSKQHTADPESRICDAPGSWHCTGVYPPALEKLLNKTTTRKAFQQLEDFNVKKKQTEEERLAAEKYNREYMARMEGRSPGEQTTSSSSTGKRSTKKKSSKSKGN